MRRTCRLACKVVMDFPPEQSARQKLISLAEKQNPHPPNLHDTPLSSQEMFSSRAGWTVIKRRCCTQSVDHEQERMDFVVNAAHLAKRKREMSDGALQSHSLPATTAHLTDCVHDRVLAPLGMSVMPNESVESPLIATCRAEHSNSSTGTTAETPSMFFDATRVDKGEGRAADISNLGSRSETTASLINQCLERADDDGSEFSRLSTSAYLEECWGDDLEQAIVHASDACMHSKRLQDTSVSNPNVEDMNDGTAMSDGIAKPFLVAKCKDEHVNDSLGNFLHDGFRSVCAQSTDIKTETMEGQMQDIEALQNSSIKVAFNNDAYPSPSHFEETFATQTECHLKEEMIELRDDDWSFHPPDTPLKFSKQQMEVLEAVAFGKSVFITGSAGTGKSFLLKYIIRMLTNAHDGKHVHVTASTGLAACALNGITLHSFAGIGLGCGTPMMLAARVLRNKESRSRWRNAAVLIIDEISMIDGELFEKLEYIARRVRNSTRCFGGIQLIVTGDFFQLPPVNPPNLRKYFAFEAECWDRCFDMQVELEHVFRQSDSIFVKMLNEIRKGVPTPETLQKLSMCCRVLPDDGTGIVPTRLYPLKVDVRQENLQEMRALQTSIVTFSAVDSAPNPLHKYMFLSMRTEKELQLCVGAQVMLIKNINTGRGLVNGTKGVVMGFQTRYDNRSDNQTDKRTIDLNSMSHIVSPSGYWPIVRFQCGIKTIGPVKESLEDGGVEVASRIQVPLILAWALSVHKCQGMTLSKVQTDLSKAFDFGMVYVALSRVKDLDGLQLTGFDPTRIKVHPNVIAFSNKLIRELALKQEKVG